MSDLNLDWVKNNFDENSFVFFDIGCMDMRDSVRVRESMPKAKIYSFEASRDWTNNNLNTAIEYGIHYFQVAVCHIDGTIPFKSSVTQYGNPHLDSGSIFDLNPDDEQGKIYSEPYDVKAIRLETFCNKLNIVPDFVHIDVEGAEYKVFQNIGNYRPKCVWAEVNTFNHYDTKTSREEFDNLMFSLNYNKIFDSFRDSLYCQNNYAVTPY